MLLAPEPPTNKMGLKTSIHLQFPSNSGFYMMSNKKPQPSKTRVEIEEHVLPLYVLIWKGHYPKRIKNFLRKLSHKALNTHKGLKKIALHHLVSTMEFDHYSESHCHIFVTCIHTSFWNYIISPSSIGTPPYFLIQMSSHTLCGHPFKKEKTIGRTLLELLAGIYGLKEIVTLSREEKKSFYRFFDATVNTVVTWCPYFSPL